MLDWNLSIAVVAIVISVISLLWNRRHSESLFRRTEYPAVGWHRPKLSKKDNDTIITTSIYNYGPKKITAIFLSAILYRGFKSKAWCKSNEINDLPIDEELAFTLTEEFEKDVNDRFGEPAYENGWRYKGRPKKYKILLKLEYQPLIADTSACTRKAYYLVKPIIENKVIKSWELTQIPNWQSWFPKY